MTAFHKKIFPAIWFGFLAVFFVGGLVAGKRPPIPFFLVPLGMATFGYFLMKFLIWDLADEVTDYGDYLVVTKNGQTDRIALGNIKNISYAPYVNPPRVSLALRDASRFGPEVVFSPPVRFSFNPFKKHPSIEELIDRVDETRRSGNL